MVDRSLESYLVIVFPIKNNDPQKTKYSIMQELENYKKDKLTINIVWANVFGILILIPITLIFGLPYYLRWGAWSWVVKWGNNTKARIPVEADFQPSQ